MLRPESQPSVELPSPPPPLETKVSASRKRELAADRNAESLFSLQEERAELLVEQKKVAAQLQEAVKTKADKAQIADLDEKFQELRQRAEIVDAQILSLEEKSEAKITRAEKADTEKAPEITAKEILKETWRKINTREIEPSWDLFVIKELAYEKKTIDQIDASTKALWDNIYTTESLLLKAVIEKDETKIQELALDLVTYEMELTIWTNRKKDFLRKEKAEFITRQGHELAGYDIPKDETPEFIDSIEEVVETAEEKNAADLEFLTKEGQDVLADQKTVAKQLEEARERLYKAQSRPARLAKGLQKLFGISTPIDESARTAALAELPGKITNLEENLDLLKRQEVDIAKKIAKIQAENRRLAAEKKAEEDTKILKAEKEMREETFRAVREIAAAEAAKKAEVEKFTLTKKFLTATGDTRADSLTPSEAQGLFAKAQNAFNEVQTRAQKAPEYLREELQPIVNAEGLPITTFDEYVDTIISADKKTKARLLASFVKLATAVGEGATLGSLAGAESAGSSDINDPESFTGTGERLLAKGLRTRISETPTVIHGEAVNRNIMTELARQKLEIARKTALEIGERAKKEAEILEGKKAFWSPAVEETAADLKNVENEIALKINELQKLISEKGTGKTENQEKIQSSWSELNALKKEQAKLASHLKAEKAALETAINPPTRPALQPIKPKGVWSTITGWFSRGKK